MKEQSRDCAVESSQVCFETLEAFARMKVQEFLQQVLEEEVSALLQRGKHGRRARVSPVDPPAGSRNGHAKPRRFAMLNGTLPRAQAAGARPGGALCEQGAAAVQAP